MSARSMLLAAFAFVVASTACQPPAQEAAGLSEEDVAAIRDASQAFVRANLASDWTAGLAVLTEDAVWMPPNEPALEGRAAIQEWLTPFTVMDFELTALETEGHGGLAYRRGRYSFTVTTEGTPEPITDTGKYVEIWRKQPDGSWLTDQVIWNSDQPLPQQSSGTEQ